MHRLCFSVRLMTRLAGTAHSPQYTKHRCVCSQRHMNIVLRGLSMLD